VSSPHTFHVGALRCHLLDAGLQRLDGGAMFGVVPKPLWERRIAPDARNRIPLAMRPLLVEHPDGLVLVDTGLGDKEDAKFHEIYGIENAGDPGPTLLEDGLRALGHRPADVRRVINTHLHFDHAGGNTLRDGADGVRLGFPNATYLVQRNELEYARHTNERTRASYLPHNFEPVDAAGRWRLLDGDGEVLPGISVRLTPGHVPWHQSILVRDGGETLCFLGDLIPTSQHLPLPWIMGYDVEPLRTLESKRALLAEAGREGWLLVFEHDPVTGLARAGMEGGRLVATPVPAPAGA
jgi:glyoxylase-like metal-dependent hydrolase (beta-lactamase superfamily II)